MLEPDRGWNSRQTSLKSPQAFLPFWRLHLPPRSRIDGIGRIKHSRKRP